MNAMLKNFAKAVVGRLGYSMVNVDRLGIDYLTDFKRLLAGHEPTVLFDVGANTGQTAVLLAERFPTARVYSFEPVPSTFSLLKSTVAGYPNITAHNFAMGDKAGRARMHLADWHVSNSLLDTPTTTSSGDTIDVEVQTVTDFSVQQHIELIDLLKIDVEGFEPRVLDGAAKLLLGGSVRFCYLECRVTRVAKYPHAELHDLTNQLAKYSFTPVAIYCESVDLKSGSLLCNALFAHSRALPRKIAGRFMNVT